MRINRGARDAIHLVLVGGLVAMIALQVLGKIADGPGALLVLIALAIGVGGAFLYLRTEAVQSLLTVLSPAPLIFIVVFLFFSDAKDLVVPEDDVQAAEIAVPGKTPVVMITFDEFQGTMLLNSKHQIDRTLFPHFAELADRGTFYPNATTEADLTPRAVPAIMDGDYPDHDALPTAADHPNSIFTTLGGDYSMHVAEPVTSVCPASLCGEKARPPTSDRLDSLASDLRVVYEHLLLPESMEDSLPAVDETFQGFGDTGGPGEGEVPTAGEASEDAPDTAPNNGPKSKGAVETQFDAPNESFVGRGQTFEDWLDELTGDKRTLNFLHLELPHVPYEFYPNGQRYAAGLLENDGLRDSQGRNPDDPGASILLQQRMLLQVGFTDFLLGKVIKKLKQDGIWDHAIVTVAADHGVGFQPGLPRRVPNKAGLSSIASVPLIIKGPGVPQGKLDDRLARTIDIAPTIYQILGIKPPPSVTGSSLLQPPPKDRTKVRIEDRYQRVISKSKLNFERQRNRVLAQKLKLFGSDMGWARVYEHGPFGSLVGRVADDLPQGPPASGTVTLASPESFDDVHPTARYVPGAIRAVDDSLEPNTPLAFAVNGRIVATAQTYRAPDHMRAFAMVPPTAFREGANSVEVFVINPGAKPSLSSIGGTG
jgi:hypothetical protein